MDWKQLAQLVAEDGLILARGNVLGTVLTWNVGVFLTEVLLHGSRSARGVARAEATEEPIRDRQHLNWGARDLVGDDGGGLSYGEAEILNDLGNVMLHIA